MTYDVLFFQRVETELPSMRNYIRFKRYENNELT